ncbi:MAG: hypothetical protein Q7J60_18220 [Bradyrhizobium sp.]|nr:hypothetical protein [Bradyrhizobium sp.]
MTAVERVDEADTTDLFAAGLRRERVVDWQAPGPVARAAAAMSDLDAMRAIRDGVLPEPPPLARLIDFRLRVAEPGLIVMELDRIRIKLGRQTSYAEGWVRDGAGNLAVHATAAFSMVG